MARNLGRRELGTVDGLTAVRVLEDVGGNSAYRQGVQVANCDSGRSLFVRLAASGASAPSVGSADFDFAIGPRGTLVLEIGEQLEAWILSDSGSVATSAYSALEVLA